MSSISSCLNSSLSKNLCVIDQSVNLDPRIWELRQSQVRRRVDAWKSYFHRIRVWADWFPPTGSLVRWTGTLPFGCCFGEPICKSKSRWWMLAVCASLLGSVSADWVRMRMGMILDWRMAGAICLSSSGMVLAHWPQWSSQSCWQHRASPCQWWKSH